MPATAKLYETDPYVQTFTATVLVCTPAGEQFAVQLDRTAFYPEGGGQPCDTGALGTALVTDVQEHGGVITHTVSAALPVGQTVEGRIDWARRRDHMEQHTGEHILSGTLHRLFGAENVGFHIGSPAVRMDMSVPLTAGQLAEAEAQANAVIRADAPVRCWYPAPEDLAKLTYRSKKEIDGADGDGLRRICLAVSARTNALTAVLASGGQGLAYALCLPGGDVRPVCKALNEAFGGRGGGKPGFCQGSLACTDFADVQNFLVNYHE